MIDKTQNPAEIYLVPVFDGDHDHVWCDTPAPGEGMREEDATRYVREDIYLALQAQVEQLRAAYINLSGAINDIDDMEEGSEEIADAWPNLFILLQQGYEVCQATPTQCLAAQHPDDAAVDRFAMAMKTKLAAARAKGRSGWDDKASCSGEHLAQLLIEHLTKGNAGIFEDIANFAMMLHQRGDDPQLLRTALVLRDVEIKAQAVINFADMIRGAYLSGFVPSDLNVYDVYQSARNHVKDNYKINIPAWDDEVANQLRQQAKGG